MPLKSFNLKIHNQINSFNKTIKVDPDKSISIRSFLLGQSVMIFRKSKIF